MFETSVWSGVSRTEKRRRYVKKFNLFIYNYIINYIISNAFFTFHNVSQRVFLSFFHLRLIEKILSSTIM